MLAARLALRRGSRAPSAAIPVPRPGAPIDHVMLHHLCLAERAVAAGDPGTALAQARQGLTELGRVRDRMGGLDLLCGTAVHGRELGDLAVSLTLAATPPSPTEAFDWLERTRAQVYRYEPLPAIDDPVLARRVAEARSVSRSLQHSRLDRRPVAELERRLEALRQEVSRLGWHTSPWGRPRPVTTSADVTPLLRGRAVVSYTRNDGTLHAVVLTDDTATLHALGPADEVAELTRQLHADLDVLAPDHLPDVLARSVSTSASLRAAALDRALVHPLLRVLDGRDLVVVPTGVLYAVPWSALPSLHGRPVVVAPSATAWTTATTGPRSAHRVVLVGGPELPEGSAEIAALHRAYPDAVVLEGKEATATAVLDSLNGTRLAHIAAHGTHAPDNALFSKLELFDGPLFAHESARLPNPPEQVVLASCELALSHIRPGDEALGFAGAMLASGSRTVVSAVSKVGDKAAADTMALFYEGLAAGRTTAQALAAATAPDPLRRPFVCFGADS